jgi:hypothetical protein
MRSVSAVRAFFHYGICHISQSPSPFHALERFPDKWHLHIFFSIRSELHIPIKGMPSRKMERCFVTMKLYGRGLLALVGYVKA